MTVAGVGGVHDEDDPCPLFALTPSQVKGRSIGLTISSKAHHPLF